MTFSTVAGSPTFNQGGGVFQLKKKPDAADMFWGHNNKISDSDLHAPDVLDLVSSAALVATKHILAANVFTATRSRRDKTQYAWNTKLHPHLQPQCHG